MVETYSMEGRQALLPPPRLYERLAQLSGYTWDQSIPPFHSTYDNWHVFGICHLAHGTSAESSTHANTNSTASSPRLGPRPSLKHHRTGSVGTNDFSSSKSEGEKNYISVVARISTHALRIEREYHLCRTFIQTSDPGCLHTVRLIDLLTLPSRQGDEATLVVSIFESPGRNYLKDLLDFGPAWLGPAQFGNGPSDVNGNLPSPRHQLSLSTFLDFAIGACECLELLHHGLRTVHGELRADAFHFNHDTCAVKLINFGSGPRSFENGLTSSGWMTLSREFGVKHKLQYVAPEQTGRMPAEPNSRTDIYGLGILFWTLLTGRPPFQGETLIDIIQAVLGRRLPSVSSERMDVPDVVARIIQKMTQKQMDERYHSVSGVKYDIVEVQRLLGEGDNDALAAFTIGSKDRSSFFLLPTNIAGRDEDRKKIVEVIEKVAKWQESHEIARAGIYAFGSTSASSFSDRYEGLESGTRSSETSSQAGRNSENGPTLRPPSGHHPQSHSRDSSLTDGPADGGLPAKYPPLEVIDSMESIQTTHTVDTQKSSIKSDLSSGQQNGVSQIQRQRGSHKNVRRRRCEVVSICGAAGSGKSSLIQSTQADIRKMGYFASAKFDPARKAPYEPLLRAMGSLFRQIFSESDSEYHNMIRSHIRGLWPSVCNMLDLPESLISVDGHSTNKATAFNSQIGYKSSLRADALESSSARSTQNSDLASGSQMFTEFLRGGANPRSLKFITVFVEIMRILTTNKLICLCLDDLQFADEESLELIATLISKKLGIVILATSREDKPLLKSVENVLKNKAANITTIKLSPLSEEEVVQYVAATLDRPLEYVIPLAVVCLEKSNGNPFYLRQMLEICHRKSCIWYSWKESAWEFDLDRVFAEFESDKYDHQLNTNFITKRLQDLPTAARSILAWASLLGTTFSFTLVQRLLSGEFDYVGDESQSEAGDSCTKVAEVFKAQPVDNVVEGLQATLQAYVLMPGSNEDEFSFSHDRYVQASASLRECHDVEKMHFIIAQTMMKYPNLDGRNLYTRARHICRAVSVIKRRVTSRYHFRAFLFEAAQKAISSGARPTALDYYKTCLTLMQPEPWREGARDVFYEETLNLYTKAAELYWHQGQPVEAQNLLDSIFARARTASDKATAWNFQSKLFAQAGNMAGAFTALKTSLLELGLDFPANPTWETCDDEYFQLRRRLANADFADIIGKPLDTDPNVIAMGALLVESVSAAFWSSTLAFYQIVLKMIDRHLNSSGTFSQVGLGFSYLCMIVICRHEDQPFGLQMQDVSNQLLAQYGDSYVRGRGLAMTSLFTAHLSSPIRSHFNIIEEAIDHSLVSGDKHVFLLCVGTIAMHRLFIGDDMADIETYCAIGPEDFGDWSCDMRGGVVLTATRQVARSLQGKTWTESPDTALSDEQHHTADYMALIEARSGSHIERPRDIYNSLRMITLYLYGHHAKVIQISTEISSSVYQLWSMRITRLAWFYTSLSFLAHLREHPTDQERDAMLARVRDYKAGIMQWQADCNANYLMWTLLIEAEMAEIEGRYGDAIAAYEAAIDHTQLHDFLLEQALAFELQGEFFIRRGARRAARSTLKEALASYARIGASGKVDHLSVKHEWVLRASATVQTRDEAIQTANTIGEIGNTQFRIEENERQETRNLGKETAGDRTQAWVSPTPDRELDVKSSGQDISDLGLDVLDLQSILEFNQAISSELQIDRLLSQMTQIILESAGAQADFAGVIIEGENGWCIAASGTAEGISADAQPVSEIEDGTQRQVLLYTMRFKELVFVHNLAEDDRFLTHGSAKSVISLPIFQGKDLLGVLYLEGQPNCFTDRNLAVLQLFCNQVGISIANALLFKRIAKVSASNTSMIESQKRALGKAREAELKAKLAEAEAMENVRLKEEAAKAKSMFLANVSHELRTPLNGVIGMSELLQATPLNEEQDSYANSIRVCADTLLTVINDILDFSKLEAGKMKLFSVPLNLKETIAEVVRALQFANIEKGLETVQQLDLDPNLLVMGDPVRLHQIFMNLLSNSYKFTAKGSVTVRANTDHVDRNSIQVTCSVTDTGIGITQEQVSRLFKPFSQADSSTQRQFGGSGLGLSICKALVEVLNGKIWLESQIGRGTAVSFTLTFPKAPKSATTDNNPIAAREPDPMATWSSDSDDLAPRSSTASFFDLSKMPRNQLRICIAEDNPINQKIAVSFVTKLGFKSEAYSDGLQAVEALRRNSREKNPFHLVLMDVQMPVLDGYDATRLIRKDEDPAVQGVLIIAMTASAIRGDREKCLQAGMNNYLAKPVRAAVLKSMLEDYLSEAPKSMPDLQETANHLAKTVMEGKQSENQNGEPMSKYRTRPSLEKRMTSRNSLPYRGQDAQSREDAIDADTTPRLPQPRTGPAMSRTGSAASVIRGRMIDGDDSVPPLSLVDEDSDM